jgi:FkbM family methyltransferase
MNRLTHISIEEWFDIVDRQCTFKPKIIMEIGSMDGADASKLAKYYNANDVFIIEAHNAFAERIKEDYPGYSVFNLAASKVNQQALFKAVGVFSENKGMSSLLDRDEDAYPSYGVEYYNEVMVDAVRMDYFCEQVGISEIDLLKIDVEGATFDVLEGFGDLLWFVKSVHLEAEHEQVWKGQKLYADVERFMLDKGFIPAMIKIGFPQSDSVWIKKEFYNHNWMADESIDSNE